MYVDRPSRDGTFETRPIGKYAGAVFGQPLALAEPVSGPAVPVAGGIAVAEHGTVGLYDTAGSVELIAPSLCNGTIPQVAATRALLFVLCAKPGALGQLTAFPR